MKFTSYFNSKKRGISTIVGGLIFVILMTSGFAVYQFGIQTHSKMIEQQQTVTNEGIKKINEKFEIFASTDPSNNNRLSVQVMNEGSNSIEIADVWIINKTDSANGYPATRYEVNYVSKFIPPGHDANVLEQQPLYLIPDSYDIKAVSSRGTIQTTSLNVAGANNLRTELFVIPPDAQIGYNVTLAMHVTNTGNTGLLDVQPDIPAIIPLSSIGNPLPPQPLPVDLAPAESTIFLWNYKITGSSNTIIKFSNNATGTPEGTIFMVRSNNAFDTTKTYQGSSGSGSGSEQVIVSGLFAKPEIFMVIPLPFGDDNDNTGLWGVNIANPTEQPIYVSKVVISAQTPRASSNDSIFPNSCEQTSLPPVAVPPTTNDWSCPDTNQLMWKNTSTPQIIEPKSVFPFLVKVGAGDIGGSLPDPSTILIQTNVFSTLGQFGKAGYGSAMHSSNSAVISNVYLSKVPESTLSADIMSNMTGIAPNSVVVFNATLADMDTSTSNVINSGSRLIINIPTGWSNVNILSHTGFLTPTFQSFPDGSSQIIGQLSSLLSGSGGVARTIQFSATAPSITETKMYIMYALADGSSTNDFTIGPLAEVVLQVVP